MHRFESTLALRSLTVDSNISCVGVGLSMNVGRFTEILSCCKRIICTFDIKHAFRYLSEHKGGGNRSITIMQFNVERRESNGSTGDGEIVTNINSYTDRVQSECGGAG